MDARGLGLAADQVGDARSIKVAGVEGIAKGVTSGKRVAEVKADVEATNGDTVEKMSEMLTRAQRERLKELRGKPFAGKVAFDSIAGPGAVPMDQPHREPKFAAHLFGQYDIELRYLADPAVWRELEIDNDKG